MKKINHLFKEHYDNGLNDSEISRILNCSNATVSIWRKKNNFSSNFKQGNIKKNILLLYNKGFTKKEIEDKGYNLLYIRQILRGKPKNTKYEKIDLQTKSFIIGTLLGDSSVSKRLTFSYGHSIKQEHYCLLKSNVINLSNKISYSTQITNNKSFEYIYCVYHRHPFFTKLRSIFYKDKKIFPFNYCMKYLDINGVALWYGDDGNMQNTKKSGYLAIHSLQEYSKEIQLFFLKKFNVKVNIQSNGKLLYFPVSEFKNFCKLIRPYLNKEMYYKLCPE